MSGCNNSPFVASKTQYGTFCCDLFEKCEQLFLKKILLFFEYSMRIVCKILPFSIMQKQLLANCFQYSALFSNAQNWLILPVIYWESLNTHCELIAKSNIFSAVWLIWEQQKVWQLVILTPLEIQTNALHFWKSQIFTN